MTPLRIAILMIIASALAATILADVGAGPSSNVRIIQLDCDTTPEVITIKNLGGAAQSLNGWELQSDPNQTFDLTVVGTLDPGEQASIFSGSNAPETNAAAGQFRWALSFKLRNGDPTDFARIVDISSSIIDQLNCGDPPPTPPPAPTSTPPATATPVPTSTATATATPGGTATPTSSPTVTATTGPAPTPGLDSDGDGCTDGQELGPNAQFGGLRDPNNFWDFFALLQRFGSAGDPNIDPLSDPPEPPAYHTRFDRGPVIGANPWNLGPPNGAIAVTDFFSLLVQFGHTCAGAEIATLQIHHIDVGQGDATLVVSPGGETALIDDGRSTNCSKTTDYLQGLGLTSLDYHFASHYHADHIGCIDDMADAGITVVTACYDRGGTPENTTATFDAYVATCGVLRQTLTAGQVITLDAGTAYPVTLTVVALNGAGETTTNENALSVVLMISYGAFDEVIAGDLTGFTPDIESIVGALVGDVEVYHVNHHGSNTSSNDAWLTAINAEVAILSVGTNSFGHPTAGVLTRLHAHDIQTYWTNAGSGVAADPLWDQVGGDIVVEAMPGLGDAYTVAGTGFTDAYVNE